MVDYVPKLSLTPYYLHFAVRPNAFHCIFIPPRITTGGGVRS